VAEFTASGVNVKAFNVDISDAVALESAMSGMEEKLPPVKGVIQAAMVLQVSEVMEEKIVYVC
jgi:hypothetical protein